MRIYCSNPVVTNLSTYDGPNGTSVAENISDLVENPIAPHPEPSSQSYYFIFTVKRAARAGARAAKISIDCRSEASQVSSQVPFLVVLIDWLIVNDPSARLAAQNEMMIRDSNCSRLQNWRRFAISSVLMQISVRPFSGEQSRSKFNHTFLITYFDDIERDFYICRLVREI